MDGATPEQVLNDVVQDFAPRLAPLEATRHRAAFLGAVSRAYDMGADLQPSADDLKAAIDLLTDVGNSADARHQEWVRLADAIGGSSRIEDLTWPRPEGTTPNTLVVDRDDPAIGHDALLGVRPGLTADFRRPASAPEGPTHSLDLTLAFAPSAESAVAAIPHAPPTQKEPQHVQCTG